MSHTDPFVQAAREAVRRQGEVLPPAFVGQADALRAEVHRKLCELKAPTEGPDFEATWTVAASVAGRLTEGLWDVDTGKVVELVMLACGLTPPLDGNGDGE